MKKFILYVIFNLIFITTSLSLPIKTELSTDTIIGGKEININLLEEHHEGKLDTVNGPTAVHQQLNTGSRITITIAGESDTQNKERILSDLENAIERTTTVKEKGLNRFERQDNSKKKSYPYVLGVLVLSICGIIKSELMEVYRDASTLRAVSIMTFIIAISWLIFNFYLLL